MPNHSVFEYDGLICPWLFGNWEALDVFNRHSGVASTPVPSLWLNFKIMHEAAGVLDAGAGDPAFHITRSVEAKHFSSMNWECTC